MHHTHTPAPWISTPCHQGFYAIRALVAPQVYRLVAKIPCDRMDQIERAAADARLITATPLLFHACEVALAQLVDANRAGDDDGAVIRLLRGVIAEAGGN